MASCEVCNGPVPHEQLIVGMKGTEKVLVGPCCVPQETKINFHFELSSSRGAVAVIEYGGLTVQFKKSPLELNNTFRNLTGQDLDSVPMH